MHPKKNRSHAHFIAPFALFSLCVGLATVSSGCESEPPAPVAQCDAGNEAFVTRALLALNGRRAWSQSEVDVWVEALTRLEERGEAPTSARARVARAMMFESDTYRERWSLFFMDSLRVLRSLFVRPGENWSDKVNATTCYGPELVASGDNGELAAWVRDNPPTEQAPPYPNFTLGRLLSSSIALDDMTPVYRAQLFHMVQFPMGGANVDELEREAARRNNFGTIFADAYLHRDPSCTNCHNAMVSPTASSDPEKNRFWPLPGRLEYAVFGSDAASDDPVKYWSVFRVMDVRNPDGGTAPWGWYRPHCGGFDLPTSTDPLAVDAKFASVTGKVASVWSLEESLRRGFEKLSKEGLVVETGSSEVDPDAAFAYLVSANITEKVWTEVMGHSLTIAHKFPRNEIQRDTLQALTQRFITSGFSLKALLTDIVTHPTFNLPAAADWSGVCGDTAYALAPLFNPWSSDEIDPALQKNSVGDAVFHLSIPLVQLATHRALEWESPAPFPKTADDQQAMAALGHFISGAKPGFRGLGFQPKLAFEDRYGLCAWPGYDDFITQLSRDAATKEGATIGDAVVALKDRLINEAFIDPLEVKPLEDIVGAPLSASAQSLSTQELDGALRIVCGGYLASPQSLLGGLAPAPGGTVPKLTPSNRRYGPSCAAVSALFDDAQIDYILSCHDGSLALSKR